MTVTISCDIVSVETNLFSGQIEMLVAPGVQGELGIMPGHAPLLTSLHPGPVKITHQGGTEEVLYISGGFLEVLPDKIKILADAAERAVDMDEAAAFEAKKQAEKALDNKTEAIDYGRAMAQLTEASARLRTVQMAGKRKKVKKIDTRY